MSHKKSVLEIRDLLHIHERRDLDAFIAGISGWTSVSKVNQDLWSGIRPGGSEVEPIPHYHSDMSEILEVAEEICLKNYGVNFKITRNNEEYHVEWDNAENGIPAVKIASASNVSAPLALAVSCVEAHHTLYKK